MDRAAFPVPLLSHFSLLPPKVLIRSIFWECREEEGTRGEKKEKETWENGTERKGTNNQLQRVGKLVDHFQRDSTTYYIRTGLDEDDFTKKAKIPMESSKIEKGEGI